ncbi:tRNA lysidine(34) synthetase TilS [Noviherbaspirillum aerium]|uniref:tRNA lysidine(34) synthetase TilS n=1 Tax=Noviherbaspirillum aerium TaxID=2588497 RepID=UPI001CEF96ED|nr:tRNA lysidine(34) synthetase TilS [Noviherbaspirillum aerium]
MVDKQSSSSEAGLVAEFERALGAIRARVSAWMPDHGGKSSPMAVAYSGGLDSAVLLHLAHAYAAVRGIRLHAFHVHHGLSPNADDWMQRCEQQCAQLDVPFEARRITLDGARRHGVEQAARNARYAALGALCASHAVPLLITGHHQDDQAETVLLQLFRGSGVAGLSGMDAANRAPALLGNEHLVMGRPMLGITRSQLEQYAAMHGIDHVEDESNADPRYARNALRHRVMPVIGQHFQGYQERIARSASHAQAAQRILDEVAAQDLERCSEGEAIRLSALKAFSDDRCNNLLRYWLASHGLRMPAAAWLDEMRIQLFSAKEDARIRITHADGEIRRHRDRIHLTRRFDDRDLEMPAVDFRWGGEESLRFERYGGTLHFEEKSNGIDPAWLRGQSLQLRFRLAGDRLKLGANRPTRSLKQHYQALGIPHWERERLPVVTAGGRMLYAGGIGMHWHDEAPGSENGMALRWVPDQA